jgi:hypothetical protein
MYTNQVLSLLGLYDGVTYAEQLSLNAEHDKYHGQFNGVSRNKVRHEIL